MTAATGGVVTNIGIYTIHTFLSTANLEVLEPGDIDYFILGGGGGAGNTWGSDNTSGGGGGAKPKEGVMTLVVGTYPAVVGLGGAGFYSSTAITSGDGLPGDPSSFNGVSAEGGGCGRRRTGTEPAGNYNRTDSGAGGAWCRHDGTTGSTAPAGVSTNGGDGGESITTSSYAPAGGGGGAGEDGDDGVHLIGGDGGDGVQSSISGTPTWYGGGGGGGIKAGGGAVPGDGGLGGGGRGAGGGIPTAGVANTGGGGGGGKGSTNFGGREGGSGIIIIRYIRSYPQTDTIIAGIRHTATGIRRVTSTEAGTVWVPEGYKVDPYQRQTITDTVSDELWESGARVTTEGKLVITEEV
jgi:hypothetical protein